MAAASVYTEPEWQRRNPNPWAPRKDGWQPDSTEYYDRVDKRQPTPYTGVLHRSDSAPGRDRNLRPKNEDVFERPALKRMPSFDGKGRRPAPPHPGKAIAQRFMVSPDPADPVANRRAQVYSIPGMLARGARASN